MGGRTYILVGDQWEGDGKIVANGFLESTRPDAVIIRARDYPNIADALKQITPPVGNVEIHAHGSPDGTIEWSAKKDSTSYTSVFSGLPVGVQTITIHSCYGGSAEATKFLQAAPGGSTIISMAGPDTVGSTEAIRKFMSNTPGTGSPTDIYVQSLNAYDPQVFVRNSQYWRDLKERNDAERRADPTIKIDSAAATFGAIDDKSPVDYLPHIVGIGGGQRIDLAVELGNLSHKNPQVVEQAITRAQTALTTADHAQFLAVADKIRHGQPLGTAPNPIDAARELRIGYAIAAEYMDVSGELAQRQKAAVDAHTERRAMPVLSSDPYAAYTLSRLSEEVIGRYASVRQGKNNSLEVVMDATFLNSPSGQAFRQAMLSGTQVNGLPHNVQDTLRSMKPHIEGKDGVVFTIPAGQLKYGGIINNFVSSLNRGLVDLEKTNTAALVARTDQALAANPITTTQGGLTETLQARQPSQTQPVQVAANTTTQTVAKEIPAYVNNSGAVFFNSRFGEGDINPATGRQEVTLSREFLNSEAGQRFRDFLDPTSASLSNLYHWTTRPEFKGLSIERGADGSMKVSFSPKDPQARAEAQALQRVMADSTEAYWSTNDLSGNFRKYVTEQRALNVASLTPNPAAAVPPSRVPELQAVPVVNPTNGVPVGNATTAVQVNRDLTVGTNNPTDQVNHNIDPALPKGPLSRGTNVARLRSMGVPDVKKDDVPAAPADDHTAPGKQHPGHTKPHHVATQRHMRQAAPA